MPITNQNILDKLLDINSIEYYEKTLRPNIIKFLADYKTDPNLSNSLRKLVNTTDSNIEISNFDVVLDELTPILNVLSSSNYYKEGTIHNASDQEKKAVVDLYNKIQEFRMILRNEEIKEDTKEVNKRERINYDPDNRENKDFLTHNMTELNKTENNSNSIKDEKNT